MCTNVATYFTNNKAALTPPFSSYDVFRADFYVTDSLNSTDVTLAYELNEEENGVIVVTPTNYFASDPGNLLNSALASNPYSL